MQPNNPALVDGIVRIYRVDNTAAAGDAPVEALTLKACLRAFSAPCLASPTSSAIPSMTPLRLLKYSLTSTVERS